MKKKEEIGDVEQIIIVLILMFTLMAAVIFH